MPDEKELIRARLSKLGLGAQREEEIIREIDEHLTDRTADLAAGGMPRHAAARMAFDSIPNWEKLREEIIAAETEESTMNYRTKALWLPALGALTLSNGLLAITQVFGPHTHLSWLNPYLVFRPWYIYLIPWLPLQPVVGAVAAWWSRRAGGDVRYQLTASLAPAIAALGVLMLVAATAVILTHPGSDHISPRGFALMTAIWAVLPAVPLAIGAAPFLGGTQSQA